jgi:hypothetical protein
MKREGRKHQKCFRRQEGWMVSGWVDIERGCYPSRLLRCTYRRRRWRQQYSRGPAACPKIPRGLIDGKIHTYTHTHRYT